MGRTLGILVTSRVRRCRLRGSLRGMEVSFPWYLVWARPASDKARAPAGQLRPLLRTSRVLRMARRSWWAWTVACASRRLFRLGLCALLSWTSRSSSPRARPCAWACPPPTSSTATRCRGSGSRSTPFLAASRGCRWRRCCLASSPVSARSSVGRVMGLCLVGSSPRSRCCIRGALLASRGSRVSKRTHGGEWPSRSGRSVSRPPVRIGALCS